MTNHADPVERAIITARVQLLMDKPFFGVLATSLNLVDASKWCETAATDGRNLYYNREFIKRLTRDELLFLIGHETLHAALEHVGRRQGRERRIWNAAIDLIVNDILVKDDVGKMPEGGLLDPRYTDELSAEQVYDLLIQNSTTIELPLDEHLDVAGGGEGADSGAVTVRVVGQNGPPKLSEADIQAIRNEVRAAVLQAAQDVGAGNIPAGIRRLIDALTQPQMDWRALLDSHIRSSVRDDYTLQRPSRRSWVSNVILPGMNFRDTTSAAVAIDTSGSITDEMLRDFLSEVKGIMETFGVFDLWLWTFDTKIYNPQHFTADNIDDIDDYEAQGGGGTMFECNWEYMRREGLEPPRFIVFTDGFPCSTWGDPDYCDTLFIIHGKNTIVAPFGTTVHYEP